MGYKVAKKGGKKVFLREDNKEKAIYQKKILYVDSLLVCFTCFVIELRY